MSFHLSSFFFSLVANLIMSQVYASKKSLQNHKSKLIYSSCQKKVDTNTNREYNSISARNKWCESAHCSSITHDIGLSPFTFQWTCDFSLKYSRWPHPNPTCDLVYSISLMGPPLAYILLLWSSFSEAFGRHFCGSSPTYTCRLDCVGATSMIAYLVSNYPCLSHSQPTQALIEFLSLWVMSYLS